MDYIIATAKNGAKTRQKYTCRNAAVERFERLLGKSVDTLLSTETRHTFAVLEAKAADGTSVTFRTRT